MSNKAFWKGKDAKTLFYFAGQKLLIDQTSVKITRRGEEVADDVCGEPRSRLDFVTTHYDVALAAMQTDVAAIKAFIAAQKSRDLREIQKDSTVGILIYPEGGTQAAFQCRGYVLGAWEMSFSGIKDRNKLELPGRCQYFDDLPTL